MNTSADLQCHHYSPSAHARSHGSIHRAARASGFAVQGRAPHVLGLASSQVPQDQERLQSPMSLQ